MNKGDKNFENIFAHQGPVQESLIAANLIKEVGLELNYQHH